MQHIKPAVRSACFFFFRSLNPNPHSPLLPVTLCSLPISPTSHSPSFLSSHFTLETFRPLSPLRCFSSSMAAGGDPSEPLSSQSLEKQFEDFRLQLEESGSLRERIRAVVSEIESTTRLMYASLLLVHQSRPTPELLDKAKFYVNALKDRYKQLAEVLGACSGQYYRYHGDWRSETQTVVSLITFMHWLETGSLLMHAEAEEKLGLNSSEFGLDIEDYLIGVCFMSNELVRTVHLLYTKEKERKRKELFSSQLVNLLLLQGKYACIFIDTEEKLLVILRLRLTTKDNYTDTQFCNYLTLQPRYVVNQVTAGDYDCPRKVLKFLTELHAAFRMLNLRNDFLRKKFDGMKYDLRRVEEVYYDVKIRGLAPNNELGEDQGVQGQP